MAITVVTPDNLEYFKGKQDTFNDGKFALKTALPTKTSQLTNDSGYQTASQLTTAINNALASVLTWKGVKATVDDLPTSGNKTGDVWHVTADSNEYAWSGEAWEALGGVMQASFDWADITGKPSTFAPSSHTHDAATTSAAGFMSAADKTKLNGIVAGANAYTHPTSAAGAKSAGLYKIATDANGHVTAATAVAKADVTALGVPAQDTTYSAMGGASASAAGSQGLVPAPAAGKQASYLRGDGTWAVPTNTTYNAATQSANGLMSAADKKKLDGLEAVTAMTTAEIDALFD